MSTYREQSDALVALIEGSLAPDAVRTLRERLMAEPELRAEYEALKAPDTALREWAESEPEPDVDLVNLVMARVESLKAPEADHDEAAMMAYLEGELSGGEAAEVEDWLGGNAALAREAVVLSALHSQLIEMGDVPPPDFEIDLLPGVLSRVDVIKRLGNVTPFQRPGHVHAPVAAKRRGPSLGGWMAAAAVLCIVAGGLLVGGRFGGSAGRAPDTMVAKNTPAAKTPNAASSPEAVAPPVLKLPDDGVQPESPPASPVVPETSQEPGAPKLDMSTVAQAWREDLTDKTKSLGRLATMAKLTADEAKQVIETKGATPDALLGASQFLPADQARTILNAMAEKNPGDPYPRMALAMLNDPTQTPAQIAAQADAWSQADPNNAMPLYLQAQEALAQGKTSDALDLLDSAAGLDTAGLYSLDAARQRAQALIAGGVPADVATALAAGSAGSGESNAVRSISAALLDQGRSYQASGDYQTAEQLFQSVQQLGVQVDHSASMSQERLTGMETQSQAIQALQGLYQVFDNPDNLQLLTQSADALAQGIAQLTQYLDTLGTSLGGDSSTLAGLAGLILSHGDLLLNLIK